uniref:Uncharacterized protein n=1 Tax=Leersia perrieri TaxID=77586 RepID=A0A0D9VRW1_9ORYZ
MCVRSRDHRWPCAGSRGETEGADGAPDNGPRRARLGRVAAHVAPSRAESPRPSRLEPESVAGGDHVTNDYGRLYVQLYTAELRSRSSRGIGSEPGYE